MITFDRALALSRRRVLTATAAVGAVALAGPFVARRGLASSGELNFMGWAGYDFKPIFDGFTQETGIRLNFIEQPDQDAMFAQAKAGGVGAYDMAEPTADRVPNWVEQEFIEPIDEARAGLDNVIPAFVTGGAGDLQVVNGRRYGMPTVWGTEALLYKTDEVKLDYGTAGIATLFEEEYADRLTVRPQSCLVSIGRWLEAEGQLPKPYRASFADEAVMVENYDVILRKALEVKPQIAQFWKDENSATGAFRTNGCVIGQCWDTTAGLLIKEGFPAGYLAPKEGAIAWMQNFAILKGAKNVEQAYAFMEYMTRPEAAAAYATAFNANPTAKGSPEKMSPEAARFLAAAYPGDALDKLWWWPAQPTWFVAKRNEYADRFQAG
jgi:spermidine/putrescine transport system substrate-binding protein